MPLSIIIAGIAMVLGLNAPVSAAMYSIKNPAEKIQNPADKMYNPATQVNNPAANIYNPAARMNTPDPLSPPTQAAPRPPPTEVAAEIKPADEIKKPPRPKTLIPLKRYNFKTVNVYINAAKKAFVQEDYFKFISVTEDALRRINAGTLKATRKAAQQLEKYKVLGYGLLDKNE